MAVAGSSSSEEAKIGGITPEVLIFSGRNEVSPPNMRLPTWRLGYCTSSRRCARSMNTMDTITAIDQDERSGQRAAVHRPVRASEKLPM